MQTFDSKTYHHYIHFLLFAVSLSLYISDSSHVQVIVKNNHILPLNPVVSAIYSSEIIISEQNSLTKQNIWWIEMK